jgi:MFS family permease
MFALAATAWVVPGLIGPAIAGVLAEQVGWRIVFVGVLPFIAIALALTLPSLVKLGTPPAESAAGSTALRRLPVAVAVSVAAGMVLAGLSSESPILFAVLVPLGLLIGVPAFARLTPPGTLTARRGLPAAVLIRGFLTFAFFAVYPYIPFALIDWRGLNASEAGIVLTAATLSWSAAAWVAARLVPLWGEAPPIRLGFAILVLGLIASLVILVPGVPPLLGAFTFGVAGFGIGTAYSPISLTVLSSAAPAEVGSATAGLQLSDVLGQSLGPGVSGALLATSIRAGVASGWALAAAFGLAVAVAIAGLILTSRLAGRARQPVSTGAPVGSPEALLAPAPGTGPDSPVPVGPPDTVR